VDSKPGGTLTIDKARYELLQLHFHAPSEHTIEGVHYPVEMHLVHKSSQGELAVLGVFFEEGDHHAALDSLTQNLPAQEGEAFEPEGVSIDVSDLLPETGSFYRYPGSLTTPPCSEGVLWTVLIDPVEISEEQCSGFTSALGRNNRPVQPLHEREVMVRE
jgi:carbonic anhydrase